jgi:hypothetical protein
LAAGKVAIPSAYSTEREKQYILDGVVIDHIQASRCRCRY